jgi:type IV pilus assembly protein PilN
MIRINLLGVERQKTRKASFTVSAAQRVTMACGLVLVGAAAGVGWWYWSLTAEEARVESELVAAHQEAARLQSVLAEVQQFEARRAQLQQRVSLIEQLRGGQSVPVRLLDHVSRSLPDMLWLTQLDQIGDTVTIEGRSTTLIALSDFVGTLGTGGVLQRPIDIVNSQVESAQGEAGVELIRFTVKAQMAPAAAQVGNKAGGDAVQTSAAPVR